MPSVPMKLGKYFLDRELGRGGIGVVHSGRLDDGTELFENGGFEK